MKTMIEKIKSTKLYQWTHPKVSPEFIKFSIVGLTGFVIDLTTVIIAKEIFFLDTRIAGFWGFSIATTSNYTLNRKWSFKNASETDLVKSYILYIGICTSSFLVRFMVIHYFMTELGIDANFGYIFSNIAGILAVMVINFLGIKYLAFAQPKK